MGLGGWSMRLEDVHACGKLGAVGAVMRSRAQGIRGEHDRVGNHGTVIVSAFPWGFRETALASQQLRSERKRKGPHRPSETGPVTGPSG